MKSALSDGSIVTPSCLWALFAWALLSHPVTLSFLFLAVRCASFRQQMARFCSLIHLISLCLLIGELRPLKFRVITEKYVVISVILLFV
jgi:hypothetical protein